MGRHQSTLIEAEHGAFYVPDHPRAPESPSEIAAELASLRTLAENHRVRIAVLSEQRIQYREQRDEAMRRLGRSELRTEDLARRLGQLECLNKALRQRIGKTPAVSWDVIRHLIVEWRTVVELVEMSCLTTNVVHAALYRRLNIIESECIPGQLLIKRYRLRVKP